MKFFKMINSFLNSDTWTDVRTRVISTLALSGIGTITNATATDATESVSTTIADLIQIATLGSYCISILVGVTVLIRFVIWFHDKNKKSK